MAIDPITAQRVETAQPGDWRALLKLAKICCDALEIATTFVVSFDTHHLVVLTKSEGVCAACPELLQVLAPMCAEEELVVIEDTELSPIKFPFPIRFFALVPLANAEGDVMAFLVAVHDSPKQLCKSKRNTLFDIAVLAEELLVQKEAMSQRSSDTIFRTEVEIALAESQARYKRISDNVPGMLYQYELDHDGTSSFPFVGAGSIDLLGVEPEELTSDPRKFFEFVHPDDQDRCLTSIMESAVSGEVWEIEFRLVLANEEVRWIRAVSRPEYKLNGAILWDGMMVDITERKQAECALAESEERFRLTVESAMDGVVATDDMGRVTGWNHQCEVMFGWPAAEVIGRCFVDLAIAPESGNSEDVELFRSLTHPEALNRRVVIRAFRRDGSTFPLEFAWTSVGQATTMTYVAFLRDITERKTAEEDLRLAKEEAERANRGKSEFLSRMSHELRTPLNAILGFGQLLELEELGEDSNESVGHIMSAGRHLLELINEVLDISRIEAGQISLRMESVHPHDLILETVSMMQPLADSRNVTLYAPPCDESISVYADPQRLKQVLLNLISNGVKYTREHGTVCVRVSKGHDAVYFKIEDDGYGIEPESMDRLFVPFDRLGADHTEVEGTGLGLPLAKRLVQEMGGEITVHSVVGRGTTFTVSLLSDLEGLPTKAA